MDAARGEGDHFWDSYYIKFTSGSNAGLYRVITDWDLPTTTFTHLNFPNAVVAGDVYVLSAWQETKLNMAAGDATPSILYDDVFRIEAVFDAGAVDENVYFEKDITNLDSDIYTHYVLRYKTDSSNVSAKAMLVFTVGTQTILPLTSNTSWTVVSGTITPSKTIDKIRFYADDEGVNGTFNVYYDFLLLCRGVFTWSFLNRGESADIINRNSKIGVPGRGGDVPQHGGRSSIPFHLWGEMDTAAGWRGISGTGTVGLLLYKLILEADSDPWQWFTSDLATCKVSVDQFTISKIGGSGVQRVYDLLLSEYRRGDAYNEEYYEQLGLSES